MSTDSSPRPPFRQNDMRAKLEARLDELSARTERLERDLRRAHDRDGDEQAIERENDEVLEQLSAEGREEIRATREALERLEAGTYGRCAACAAPIGDGRLQAQPFALRCIECASAGA